VKVFISWSGERSKRIALALRDWLPQVIQSIDPFMSAEDIGKGSRWSDDISRKLEQSNFGLIAFTPENMNEPWLLFEAGALSKLEGSRVCMYLWEMDPPSVPPPLGQFQATRADEKDTLHLIKNLNGLDEEKRLPEDRLAALVA
jgi:hypothetical protein